MNLDQIDPAELDDNRLDNYIKLREEMDHANNIGFVGQPDFFNPWGKDFDPADLNDDDLKKYDELDWLNMSNEGLSTISAEVPWVQSIIERRGIKDLVDQENTGTVLDKSIERTFDKVGATFKDAYTNVRNISGDISDEEAMVLKEANRQEQARRDQAFSHLAEEYPVTTIVGEALPATALGNTNLVAGSLARSVTGAIPKLPAPVAARVPDAVKQAVGPPQYLTPMEYGRLGQIIDTPGKGNVATSIGRRAKPILWNNATVGALEGLAHYDDNPLEGALYSWLGGKAAKGLGGLFRGNRSPSEKLNRTVDFAAKHNLMTPPGLVTGLHSAQAIDKGLASQFHTMDIVQEAWRESDRNINTMLAKKLNVNPEVFPGEFTDEFFDTYQQQLEGVFTDLLNRSDTPLTDRFLTSYGQLLDTAEGKLTAGRLPGELHDKLRSWKTKVGNRGGAMNISGEEYNNLYTTIANSATKLRNKGEFESAAVLDQLNERLDSNLDLNQPGISTEWAKARERKDLAETIKQSVNQNRQKGGGGSLGNADPEYIAERYAGDDEDIRMLGEYVKAIKDQRSASLSATQELSKNADPISATGLGRTAAGVLKRHFSPSDEAAIRDYLSGRAELYGFLGTNAPQLAEAIEGTVRGASRGATTAPIANSVPGQFFLGKTNELLDYLVTEYEKEKERQNR